MSKKVKNSENTPQVKTNKYVGFGILKAVLYVLTFPVIIGLAMLICVKAAMDAPFYGFWMYLPAIIAALFGLIFLIVALCVNRKGSKRNAMQKTASLLICCIILTGGFGILMDVVFPDVIAMATSSTLFVEDVYNQYEEKTDLVLSSQSGFIRLNLTNGNYDGALAYSVLKDDADVQAEAQVYADTYDATFMDVDYDAAEEYFATEYAKLTDRGQELYNHFYQNEILLDYDFAFNNGFARRAFCLALVNHKFADYNNKSYQQIYADLCKEGIQTKGMLAVGTSGNAKMSWLFTKNYASMDLDGYLPLDDDCGLGYATGNRMTIPVVIRLILDDVYSYTQPVFDGFGNVTGYNAVGYINGEKVEADGFTVYQFNPDVASAYTGEFDANGRSTDMFEYDGKLYYAYDDGHVEEMINWCVLDMLGDPMPLVGLNLGELLGDILPGIDVSSLVNSLLDGNSAEIEELLNGGLTNQVITTAADGQKLYLSLYIDDDGLLQISLVPQALKVGVIGYQYMTWMESGHLLATICNVMALRNLLYIFGAVSIVMIFAIGTINSHIEKARQDAGEEPAPKAKKSKKSKQIQQDEDALDGTTAVVAVDDAPVATA